MYYHCIVESLYNFDESCSDYNKQSKKAILGAIILYWAYWFSTERVFYATVEVLPRFVAAKQEDTTLCLKKQVKE